MRTIKKQVLKTVAVMAKHVANEWPPFCAGIFHQPKRPKRKS